MFVPLHLPMITQRYPFLALCLALVLASVVACSNNGEEMRRQLNELQARNQADSLMTDDSLALTLCDYFDSHGTPNEQMLAHYLLGRTYADMGEAPMALSEYHKAIDKADTANSNCDYALLCRVYSQMASIFFMQNLMEEYLDKLNESIFFAEKANDTIAAINSLGHKMLAYDRLQMPDSVAYLCDRVYETLCSIGQHQLAAQFSGFGINSFLKLRQVDKAKFYLQQYEIDSGYFDNINDVEIGREAYYNLKGRYYMLTLQYDSAEYFFRKELQYGHDLDNQNMASRDLSLLYQKIRMVLHNNASSIVLHFFKPVKENFFFFSGDFSSMCKMGTDPFLHGAVWGQSPFCTVQFGDCLDYHLKCNTHTFIVNKINTT